MVVPSQKKRPCWLKKSHFPDIFPDFYQLVRKLGVQELNEHAIRKFAGIHMQVMYLPRFDHH